ncbi:MAG: cell division protein FtsH, partial [Pseudomonadota bacterium]
AKDKIFMGPERKSAVMDAEELKNTAYHEAGHAIVMLNTPKHDPVHKVTIMPRGRALGVTFYLPEKDRHSQDKEYMLANIASLFGGRIAEEVFMNQMTTGASNDFERATSIARDMVMRYGMSDLMGPMVYADNEGEVFLGRSVTKTTNISESTMQKVDSEVRRIIDEQYALARRIIETNRDKVEAITKALLEWETIGREQLDDIMAGKVPRPPKDWTPRTPPSGSSGSGDSGGSPVADPAPTTA